MPMSKDEFQALVSTEMQTHGEFNRDNVLADDLSAFVETASKLNASINYTENTNNDLFTATIKPQQQ